MKAYKALLMAAAGLYAMSTTAVIAADLGDSLKDSTDYGYSTVYGPWMVRGRILGVIPDEGTSNWNIPGDPDVDIDNSVVPELDITYFFTNNIAAELILGVTPHDISGAGDLAAVDDIGSVWLLPPTLLLQYHFELDQGIKPYVGAGINYTVFFNEDGGDLGSLDLENSFGWALQAGVDIPIQDNWYLNVDVKKLWLDTEATVNGGAITADVDIDPWIIGVGLGYRFGGYDVPLK